MSEASKEPDSVEGIHADDEKRTSTRTESNDNPAPKDADNPQHITGLKLGLVVVSLVLACFLLLLDTSVISTVRNQLSGSCSLASPCLWLANNSFLFSSRLYLKSQTSFTLSQMSAGMAVLTLLDRTCDHSCIRYPSRHCTHRKSIKCRPAALNWQGLS